MAAAQHPSADGSRPHSARPRAGATARPRQVRIVGAEREALAADVSQRYLQGESIRGIAEDLDRSYGFVQALLRETNTRTRPRGGDHQPSALDVPDPLRIEQTPPPMPRLLPDERPLDEDPIARTIRWLTGREPSAPATDHHGAADRSTDDQQAAEQEKKMKSGKKQSDTAKSLGKKAKAELAKLEKAASKKAKKAAAEQEALTKKAKKQAKADKQAAKDRAKKAGLKAKKAADKQKKAKPETKKAQLKKAAKKDGAKKGAGKKGAGKKAKKA